MKKAINIIAVLLIVAFILFLFLYFTQEKTKKLEERKYKDIENIIIDSDIANINFYKSEDDNTKVIIYGFKSDKVELIEGTKELTINKNGKSKNCFFDCKNEIDIYIPFPSDLNSLNIKTDVGNINADEFNIRNVSITSNVGNINLGNCNVVNITTDVGNVDINYINGNNNSSIKTDVGNVNINTINNLKIDSKSDVGKINIPENNSEFEFTLKIETNVGNIKVKNYEIKAEQ